MVEWAADFHANNRTLLVESCGNGPNGTNPKKDPTPMPAFIEQLKGPCPFSFFRVSVDVAPQFNSVVFNANRAVPYLGEVPLSRPGCFAYADMLEVGVKLNYTESQTHFALWAVISSPLILGFDLTDERTLASVWNIIANREVINVSQSWAGHPGRLVANSSTYMDAVCEHGATAGRKDDCRLPFWQVWAKPQGADAVAVLVVNNGHSPVSVTVPLASVGLDGKRASVRDLWAHTDNGTISNALQVNISEGHGGVFVLLTPA